MSSSTISLNDFRAFIGNDADLDRQLRVGKDDQLAFVKGKTVSSPKWSSKAAQQNMTVRAALANAVGNTKGLSAEFINRVLKELGLGGLDQDAADALMTKPLFARDIRRILGEVVEEQHRVEQDEVEKSNAAFKAQAQDIRTAYVNKGTADLEQKCTDVLKDAEDALEALRTTHPKCPADVLDGILGDVKDSIARNKNKAMEYLGRDGFKDFEAQQRSVSDDVKTLLDGAEKLVLDGEKRVLVKECEDLLAKNNEEIKGGSKGVLDKLEGVCKRAYIWDIGKRIKADAQEKIDRAIESAREETAKYAKDGDLAKLESRLNALAEEVKGILGRTEKTVVEELKSALVLAIGKGTDSFCKKIVESFGSNPKLIGDVSAVLKYCKDIRDNAVKVLNSNPISTLDDAPFVNEFLTALADHRTRIRKGLASEGDRFTLDSCLKHDGILFTLLSERNKAPSVPKAPANHESVIKEEKKVEPPKVKVEEVKVEEKKVEPPKVKVEEKKPEVVKPQTKPIEAKKPVFGVTEAVSLLEANAKMNQLLLAQGLDEMMRPYGSGLGSDKWMVIGQSLKAELMNGLAALKNEYQGRVRGAVGGGRPAVEGLLGEFKNRCQEFYSGIRIKARLCGEMNERMVQKFYDEQAKKEVVKHVQSGYPTKNAKDDVLTSGSFRVDSRNKTIMLPPDTFRTIFKTISFQLMDQDLHRLIDFHPVSDSKKQNGVNFKCTYIQGSGLFAKKLEPTIHTTMKVVDGKLKIQASELSGQNWASTALYRSLQTKAFGNMFQGKDANGHFGEWFSYAPAKDDKNLADISVDLNRMAGDLGLGEFGFDMVTDVSVGKDGSFRFQFA